MVCCTPYSQDGLVIDKVLLSSKAKFHHVLQWHQTHLRTRFSPRKFLISTVLSASVTLMGKCA